jgi:hypothetical protein
MLVGTAGGVVHGFLLLLRIFLLGNVLNSFTDRTTYLCTLNYTALAIEFCPEGYQLTLSNYYTSFS